MGEEMNPTEALVQISHEFPLGTLKDRLAALEGYAVTDEASAEVMRQVQKEATQVAKEIKARKDRILKPQLEATKETRAFFKPYEDLALAMKATAKAKVEGWLLEVQRRAQEARQAAEKAARELRAAEDEKTRQEAAESLKENAAKTGALARAATQIPTQERWEAAINDLPAFLRYVADNAALHGLIEIRLTEFHSVARSQRIEGPLLIPGTDTPIPGLTIVKRVISVGR